MLSAMYYPDDEEFKMKYYNPDADDNEWVTDMSDIAWEIDHYRIDGIS